MKKSFALIASTVLVLTALAGCGGQKGNSDQSASADKSASANQSSSNESKTEDTKQPIKLKWMVAENPVQPVKAHPPSLDEVLKKTNADIELQTVSGGNYDEKKNALIATNNIPDIIQVSVKDLQDFGRSGMFLPISDYLQYMPHFKKLIDERPEEINTLKVDGKLYALPVLEKFRIGVGPQPLIRTDLLAKLNLPVPTTFDELYNDLKALKKAYPDSIPFTGRNGTLFLLGNLAFPMGSGGFPGWSESPMYYEPDQKQYLYGPIQPDFKKVVAFANKLYAEKLLDPDYAVNTKDMAFEKLSSGKSFFYYDNNTFAARVFNPALREKDPNAKFEMIPPLKNDKGEIRSYRAQRDWLDTLNAISSKVKDPVTVAKLFDWLYSDEGAMVSNFGVEGVHYDIVDGKPVVKQALLDKYKNQEGDVISAIRSEVGLGLLGYSVYVDETWDATITDPYMVEMGKQIDEETKTGQIEYMPYDPPFNAEESEQLKKLVTKVDTYFQQEIDKFIMGTKPMSEWDAFAQKLIDLGAPDIQKIYNDAYQRIANK